MRHFLAVGLAALVLLTTYVTKPPLCSTQAQRPTFAPLAFSGSGQQASPKFTIPDGLAKFEMQHDGRSNFIVWLLVEQQGRKIIALANVIGPFGGSTAVCPLASRELSRTYGSRRVSGLSARRAGKWRMIDALMQSSVERSSYV